MIEKIKGITIKGRCFKSNTDYLFFPNPNDRISIVYGKNGSGKSTIAEGIASIAILRQGIDFFAADCQRSVIDGVPSHDQGSDGGFAAAAFAHNADKAFFWDRQADAVQDLPLLFVGETNIFQFDAAALNRFFLFLGFFLAQELENFIAGPHAVHGHVEIAAQPAHGQEEIGGKQDHEDHVGKADAAADKGLRRQQNAQGRAAVGHEIHDGD